MSMAMYSDGPEIWSGLSEVVRVETDTLEADPECLRNEMSSLFSPLPDLCPPFSSHDDDDDQTSGVA
jgi:hypothetical protein